MWYETFKPPITHLALHLNTTQHLIFCVRNSEYRRYARVEANIKL